MLTKFYETDRIYRLTRRIIAKLSIPNIEDIHGNISIKDTFPCPV